MAVRFGVIFITDNYTIEFDFHKKINYGLPYLITTRTIDHSI